MDLSKLKKGGTMKNPFAKRLNAQRRIKTRIHNADGTTTTIVDEQKPRKKSA